MEQKKYQINLTRLQNLLDGINAFGFNPQTGGYNRQAYSPADMAVRDWFEQQMQSDGLTTHRDAVANLFGRMGPAAGPCILVGSHLDTVIEGGAFDGSLGVAIALECMRTIAESKLELTKAIEIVATADEEGRFGGMLGSQAIVGVVDRQWMNNAVDANGARLVDQMRACGLDPEKISAASRRNDPVEAFLELHVEQGPVLESANIPVGIANSVSGVCYLSVILTGTANHSGTTPMELRNDAFAGLCEIASKIPALIANHGADDTRVTIGKADIRPNHPHTIAGQAEFTIIIRDTDKQVMKNVEAGFREIVVASAARHGLLHGISVRSWLDPVILDQSLVSLFKKEADRLGLESLVMPSGAGHDAQTMQSAWPSALLFVPSKGGISHAPEEFSAWPDIEKGANLLLNMMIKLACE
jgi:hydantoinase/carbamoylase family amidase